MQVKKGNLSIDSENIFPIIKEMGVFRSRHFLSGRWYPTDVTQLRS